MELGDEPGAGAGLHMVRDVGRDVDMVACGQLAGIGRVGFEHESESASADPEPAPNVGGESVRGEQPGGNRCVAEFGRLANVDEAGWHRFGRCHDAPLGNGRDRFRSRNCGPRPVVGLRVYIRVIVHRRVGRSLARSDLTSPLAAPAATSAVTDPTVSQRAGGDVQREADTNRRASRTLTRGMVT